MYRKVNGTLILVWKMLIKNINALASLTGDGFTVYLCQLYLGCFYRPPPSWLNFKIKNHFSRVLVTWFPPWWWQGIAWNLFPAVVPMVSRQNPFSILRTYSYMKTIAKSSMSKGYFIKFHHFTVELQACVW